MPGTKGHSGRKPGKGTFAGGRPKGALGKVSRPVKQLIAGKVEEYISGGSFDEDLAALDPVDRLAAIEKYMNYVMPKIRSQELSLTDSSGEKQSFFEILRSLGSDPMQ